ncbi:MAG: undecaprenyl-diphosphate phosphatase [Bacteroidia bacterium]|nr:undecaprenyl-diphosphate phosphatase [Bacteroidia bacterium]MDW8333336.1 undecaprenyl-diphosphate phosphatase [Bacteroidia bacterium]
MSWLEAILLGLVQGLTEFLPVSSDGHLELGKTLLKVKNADNMTLSVVLHLATALSSVVVFRKEIAQILSGLTKFRYNEHWDFVFKVLVSAIPAGVVGLTFKEELEALFNGNLVLTGLCLIITSAGLWASQLAPRGQKSVSFVAAFCMGAAQAAALLPGLSRSGSTVSVAMLLGIDRAKAAVFSFLMVLPVIFGGSFLELLELLDDPRTAFALGPGPLVAGFLTAFATGVLACKTMVVSVKRGGLWPFALYTLLIGSAALYFGLR